MSPLCCLYYSIIINIYRRCRCRTSCPADYVTSSFPFAINNGIAIIKLAEVLLLQTSLRWQRQTNQHTITITQQSNRDDGERVSPPDGGGGWHTIAAAAVSSIKLDKKRGEHLMCIRGGSMMMKQQSTYARLQNTYWTIYKYGRLLLYLLYGMRRQKFD